MMTTTTMMTMMKMMTDFYQYALSLPSQRQAQVNLSQLKKG